MSIRWTAIALWSTCALPGLAAETSFEYCTVCHGANGNGNVAIRAPKIAGIEPWYLKNQFAAFKAGWRGAHADDAPGNEMRPVAAILTDAEIDHALAYVARFSPRPPPITVSGDAARGKELFSACGPATVPLRKATRRCMRPRWPGAPTGTWPRSCATIAPACAAATRPTVTVSRCARWPLPWQTMRP